MAERNTSANMYFKTFGLTLIHLSKDREASLKGVSTGQIWVILRIKVSSDGNTLLLFVV